MNAGAGLRLIDVQWISVKDRLPPCAATVLVYVPKTGNRLRAFYYEDGCWYEDTEFGDQPRIAHKVTHWMELPPAPEGA